MDEEIEVLSLDEEEKDNTNKSSKEDSIKRENIVVAPKREKKHYKKKQKDIIVVPQRLLKTNSFNKIKDNTLKENTVLSKEIATNGRIKVLVVPPRIIHPLVYKERSEELIKNKSLEKQPNQKNKTKIWVIILTFILLVIMLGSFYLLPKIDKYINIKYLNGVDDKKTNNVVKDTTDEIKKTSNSKTATSKKPFNENLARTFSCNKNGVQLTDNINYSSNVVVYYVGIKVKKIKILTTEIFAVKNDTYNQLVESCNNTIPSYNDKDGYNSVCTVNDNTIAINTEYDLTVFTPIKDDTISIKSPFELDTKIARVKAIYTTTGYSCD